MWARKTCILGWALLFFLFSFSSPLLSAQDLGPSLWASGELEQLLDSVSSLNPGTMVLNAGELGSMLGWLIEERESRKILREELTGLRSELTGLRVNLTEAKENQQQSQTLYEQQSRALVRTRITLGVVVVLSIAAVILF